MSTAVALATNGKPNFEKFPQQVADLSNYLWNTQASPVVSPRPPANMPLWMLGSSPDSAVLAAQRGLPYNLGLFINPQADTRLISHYKTNFQASEQRQQPYAILTLSVFCADSEPQAKALQLTHELNLFRFFTGLSGGASLTPQEAQAYPLGPQEQAFSKQNNSSNNQ